MTTLLSSASTPIPAARIARHTSDGTLLLDTKDLTLNFHGRSAEILQKIYPDMDGKNRIQALAQRADIPEADLIATLAVMEEEQLLLDTAAAGNADSQEKFMEAFRAECLFWTEDIWEQPFWKTILSGEASKTLVFGWGVEFFHFVESANEHMAMAVAACRNNSVIRRFLGQHFTEEYNHSGIFLEGLVASGLDREQVVHAAPLPATRALINYLTELAASNPIAYAGAFGIMQSNRTGTTRTAINRFYDLLCGHYGFAAPMFESFRKHALMDLELDHQEILLDKICQQFNIITPPVAQQILSASYKTVEHFMLFFENIFSFYGDPEASALPRRAFDFRAIG